MSNLEIKNLHVNIEGKEILKGLDLTIEQGKVHAIMGPNGTGKSTLAYTLMGHPSYTVTEGEVTFKGQNVLELEPDERSRLGIFLAFQYPIEVPGITNISFLQTAFNSILEHQGSEPLSDEEFRIFVEEKLKIVSMKKDFLERPVNVGFSGGEKKRNEILQMAVLAPRLALLDETDSGLDIDALRIVSEGVNKLRRKDNAIVLVTHYQRLLQYIKPDFVHVLANGKIIETGDYKLAETLEQRGYDWLVN